MAQKLPSQMFKHTIIMIMK